MANITYTDKVENSGATAEGRLSAADANEIKTVVNGKQDSDADLTAIGALTPSNDDFLQRKAGAWTNRTVAHVKADLALNNVDNTSDVNKPVSTAQQIAIDTVNELGSIFDNTIEAGSTSLYTDTTPSTTVSWGTGVTLSGGNNTSDNYLAYTSYKTNLQYWTVGMIFSPSSDGNGVGIGLVATVGRNIARMIATGANKGKVLIDIYTSSTATNRVTSATALSYTNGDSLEMLFTRSLTSWIVKVRNITTSSDWVLASYNDPLTYGSLGNTWNIGQVAIFHYGGTQVVTSHSFYSREKKYQNVCVLGDSIPSGFYAGGAQNMYTTLLGKTLGASTVCGGGNVSGDYTNLRTQFLALKPKAAVWEYGINDIRTGVSEATILANLRTFITDCNDNNIIPIIQECLPISSTYGGGSNAAWQAAVISLNTAYAGMGVRVISAYASVASGGVLNPLADAGDGLHINDWGNRNVYVSYMTLLSEMFPSNTSLKWDGNTNGFTTTQSNDSSSIWKFSNASTGTSASAQLKIGSDVSDAVFATYPSTYGTSAYQNRSSLANTHAGLNIVAAGASGTLEFCTGGYVASTNSRMTINNTDVTVQNANLKANANTSSNYALTVTNLGTGNSAVTCVNNASVSASIGVTTSSNANLPSIGFFFSTNDFCITDGTTPFVKVATTGNNRGSLTLNPISRSGLTASTEFSLFYSNSNAATYTFATGALATERLHRFRAGTIAFAGASTVTNAVNVSIGGAMAVGTNATITNTHALYIEAQAVGAATNSYGLSVFPMTGATTNYAAQFGGRVGIGTATPASLLELGAGTTTVAPFKLVSGTNLTTAQAGAFEYNGTNLFFTRSGTTRENIITTSAVNSVSPTAPDRTLTVVIDGTTYYIAAKTTND